jgi:hypothetical protein
MHVSILLQITDDEGTAGAAEEISPSQCAIERPM